jgi:hypothetical protein
MEAAVADACSKLGANLVEPKVLIARMSPASSATVLHGALPANREPVVHAVRKIFCQVRDTTDAGFIRLFRLSSCTNEELR